MVEEKDAELNEKRMQEAEVNANKTSLVIFPPQFFLAF